MSMRMHVRRASNKAAAGGFAGSNAGNETHQGQLALGTKTRVASRRRSSLRAMSMHEEEEDAASELRTIVVRNEEVAERCRNEDMLTDELRQLAIRIQKNSGVEIGDHRVGTTLYKRCFSTMQLLQWLMDTFLISYDVAQGIAKDMWMHGLISNVAHVGGHFEVSESLFFRVAHPYAINLLLLPSEMEQVYEDLRSIGGPKFIDRLHGGRLVKSCFSAAELIDWLGSVHSLTPRERAGQVAQQLMNEEYIFAIDGTTQFRDSQNLYLQHKHDFSDNVVISARQMTKLILRMAARYEELCGVISSTGKQNVRPPFNVLLCQELIMEHVQDCGMAKAHHIMMLLKKSKRLIVRSNDLTQFHDDGTRNIVAVQLAKVKAFVIGRHGSKASDKYKDGLQDDAKVIFVQDGVAVDLQKNNTLMSKLPRGQDSEWNLNNQDGDDLMKLSITLRASEVQQRADMLLSHLGSSSAGNGEAHSKSRLQSRLILWQRWVHCFLCAMLWAQVLSTTQSTLLLHDGLRHGVVDSPGFLEVKAFDEGLDWIATQQIATGFRWLGHRYPILEPPKLMLSRPTENLVPCAASHDVVRNAAVRAAQSSGLNRKSAWNESLRVDPSTNMCNLDAEMHLPSSKHTFDTSIAFKCLRNATCSNEMLALRNMSETEVQRINRMALELVLLSPKSDPALIISIHCMIKLGPYVNDAVIHTVPVPSTSGLGTIGALLAVAVGLAFVDYFAELFRKGSRYLFDLAGVLNLVRIGIAAVALATQHSSDKYTLEYLEHVSWEEGVPNGVLDVHELYDLLILSRISMVVAMFLTSMSLTAYFGGSKFNIFMVLRRTLKAVRNDVKVLVIAFITNFVGFVLTVYALMNSLSYRFASAGTTGMTMYGALFGGAPWDAFLKAAETSRVTSTVGFFCMATYLFVFIFILLNMFVAILIQSYQSQKRREEVLRRELIRHMHASEGSTDISTLVSEVQARIHGDPSKLTKVRGIQRTFSSLDMVQETNATPKQATLSNLTRSSTSKIVPSDRPPHTD